MLVDFFRKHVAKMLPRPKVLRSSGSVDKRDIRTVIVFGRHPNPTTDYYLVGRFGGHPDIELKLIDIRDRIAEDLNPDDALVVMCRYASKRAVSWICKNRARLAKVVLFLDDDIPAVIVGRDASISYRAFLYYRALYPLAQLNRYLDSIWVSTPRLGANLGHTKTLIVPPAPPPKLYARNWHPRSDTSEVSIAYHATGVHQSEHKFLQPIIADAMKKRPNIRFEVFADGRTAKIWKNMPGVTVRRPVPWSEYLAEAEQRQIDVMLVPLCDSEVNDCRAPTKRIDVARFGAAGIFSLSAAYGLAEQKDEILLPNVPSQWVTGILSLTDDSVLRQRVASATRARVHEMSKLTDDYMRLCRS
ncbi:hypothetical protein [Agrobacterium sp. SORGH_AS 787]|uniref:hypothetical protein n=1 Tax=Agrobacterium sp. SORGH_AS 787 TaxID=3041775 RepID=UPI00278372C5|nr:hypothetical protein [Rhizobium sp. SORGH_AS_0787]